MSDKEALRVTGINESNAFGTKKRFGLFSQPISNAIGDDGEYKTVLHPKNQAGKPITQPRGVFTNPTRSGSLVKSFFGDINSLAASDIKDEYIDPDRKLLQIENQNFKTGFTKDQPFAPASGFKELYLPAYEYKEENNPELDPKRNRMEDGKVKAQLRNVFSNQQSTVIRSYFKPLKHMDDPYERKHKQDVEKHKKDKSLEPEAAMKLNHHPRSLFSKDLSIYGEDVQLKPKTARGHNFNIYQHENKWKASNPNKSGLTGYFSKFPVYIEDPPTELTKKPKQEKTEPFRRMSIGMSKPSPSITLNHSNMRKTISFSLSHRM